MERGTQALLDRLRDEFDLARVAPAAVATAAGESVLLIGIAGVRLAVRTSEIQGVRRTPERTRVPGAPSSLLGIAAIRTSVLALYSLAALVLDGPATDGGWVAVARADESIGLVFDSLEGLRRVDHADAGTTLIIDGVPRSLVDIGGLVAAIRARTEGRSQTIRED